VPKPELLEVDEEVVELLVEALFCSRTISALFCDDDELELLLPPRVEVLDWNMFCSTVAACCGSPLFM